MKVTKEGKRAEICSQFLENLCETRIEKRITYQRIADETNVPYHTVCRFFQGQMDDPGVYIVSEMCGALDVPLFADEQPEPSAEVERLKLELQHRDELLTEKDNAIGRLLDRSRLMESGIEFRETRLTEKENQLKSAQDGNMPVIYGLLGLCVMLATVLLFYIVLDAKNPYQGLIRTGNVSIVIWLGVSGAIVALIAITHIVVSRLYSRRKRKGKL